MRLFSRPTSLWTLVFFITLGMTAHVQASPASSSNPRKSGDSGKSGGSSSSRESRLRVAVVIDASGSMKTQDPSLLSKVAARLFVELAGPKDEIGIVEFGTSARLIAQAYVKNEKSRQKLFNAIDEVGRDQWCTDYLAGLRAGLSMFKERPEKDERRLIIFLTDGTYDPNRSNEAYYQLLTAEEKESLWTKKAQQTLEKAKETEDFKSRPCHPRYDALSPAVRRGFNNAFESFLEKELKPAGVRVFTIGFGTELSRTGKGKAEKHLRESMGFLNKLAQVSGGRTLIEDDVNKIPGFFAQIFAALVGAPVQGFPAAGEPKAEKYSFKVVKGTRAMGIVVPTQGDKDFQVALKGPIGENAGTYKTKRKHDEMGTERRTTGRVLSGYRFFWVPNPAPGDYELSATGGKKKSFTAHVLMDVGLQLVWTQPTPKAVYAEKKQGEVKFNFALRTASGEEVGGLSEKFMNDMKFNWLFGKNDGLPVIETGSPRFDPAAPMKPMSVTIPRAKLKEGRYTIAVSATHARDFFELRKLEHKLEVVKYIKMKAAWEANDFEAKAKKGFRISPWVTLKLKEDIKARQNFHLDLSAISSRDELVLEVTNPTPGCKVKNKKIKKDKVSICLHKKKYEVTLSLSLKDWKKARSKNLDFKGKITLTPEDPEIFRGEKSWETETKGRLQAWEWRDWLRYYRNWIIFALIILFIIIWLLGRAVAGAFPPKSVFYYFDLEDKTEEPSQYALGRRAKSRLPFVSAKHTVGGKGMPRSPRVLCTVKALAKGGFEIIPDGSVSYERDGEKRETRDPFRGRFDEHYQAGERYEFWLARRPDY